VAEGDTEDFMKEDVSFVCFVFFCMSLCTSLYDAMTVIVFIFQPYPQGPFHLFEEGVMTTHAKMFSFDGALVLMVPLISSFFVMAPSCRNAHSPFHQVAHHTFQM
jgi:hypothetical protein